MGEYAWQNRDRIWRKAKRTYKWGSGVYKDAKRLKTLAAPPKEKAKVYHLNPDTVGIVQCGMNRLYAEKMIQMPYTDEANAQNRRKAAVPFVSGIHICRHFFWHGAYADYEFPVVVHYALVQANDQYRSDELSLEASSGWAAPATGIWKAQFFIANEGHQDKNADFEDTTTRDSWSSRYVCGKMGGQQYKVLKHWRKRLLAINKAGGANSNQRHWKIEKYFKIGKRMRFHTNVNSGPQRQIYEVMWFTTEYPGDYGGAGTLETANKELETWHLNKTYWRETQS